MGAILRYDLLESHPDRMVRQALRVATAAHDGQVRKYTGEPFINHPVSVAYLVAGYDPHPTAIAAALLHDVIEDTPVWPVTVRDFFGDEVGDLVESLTNPSSPHDGNRAARKAIDHAHAAKASPAAQTIKYADILDNIESIAAHDPEFARVYLAEKLPLLARIDRGHPDLHQRAVERVRELSGA